MRDDRPRPGFVVTREIVDRARQGDRDAQDSVFQAYTAPLSRFASGRLPACVRGMTDTQDLVQDVLANTARQLGRIEWSEDGALLAYLRRAIQHRIVDEIRRVRRRPRASELPDECPAPGPSPLDVAIRAQDARRTRAALCRLRARDRQAALLRLQGRLSYGEIARRMGIPTPNAARVAVRRAIVRLGEALEPGLGARLKPPLDATRSRQEHL